MRQHPVALCALFFASGTRGASLHPIGKLPDYCEEVEFLKPQFGWCHGVKNEYKTNDGGRTWQRLEPPAAFGLGGNDAFVLEIHFVSPLDAYAKASGGIFWTHDGGGSWKWQLSPGGLGAICDVHFANTRLGWALGMLETPGDPSKEWTRQRVAGPHSIRASVLYRTSDGGRNWARRSYPDVGAIPYRLEFADALHGISIELNATLFTRDGGKTWKKSRYCAAVNLAALHRAELGSDTWRLTTAQLLDASYGWWSVEGDLFQTANGGETWCQLPSIRYRGERIGLSQVRFATRTHGWAIPSQFGRTEPLPPFETRDGGKSWTAMEVPERVHVLGCAIVSETTDYFWSDSQLFALAP